ncbi:MAG: DUF2341 domain-containing protein [Akkermansiaceae bacterium]
MKNHLINSLFLAATLLSLSLTEASAQYSDWKQSGSMFILTTPEGADLAATATEKDFPLLVRLHKDFFDFSQAKTHGEDIRFSSADNAPLAYQIEQWDTTNGTATIWVKIPAITGNARQEIKMHWGNAAANSESSGTAVFNTSNNFAAVMHMNETIHDEVGAITPVDTGTTLNDGVIGKSRTFSPRKGINCGSEIKNFPSGASPHSSEAWFKAKMTNTTILAWGVPAGQGKVVMNLASPPHISMDCWFGGANIKGDTTIPMSEWVHVVHAYDGTKARLYVNGVLDHTDGNNNMKIPDSASFYIGGWMQVSGNYDFDGDIDEVRISKVARSADWVKLSYENQKPIQTLVGPLVQTGNDFSLSQESSIVKEGENVEYIAKAGGAQKTYWILKRDGREEVVATDRFRFVFDAGRVSGDAKASLQFKAVYADGVKTKDITIAIKETIPEPAFTLKAPTKWDGRSTIEVTPQIKNLAAIQTANAANLKYEWSAGPFAVIKEVEPGKLRLIRSQKSGQLTITAKISNGGDIVTQSVSIDVTEPKSEAWVKQTPDQDDKPEDGRFYARDDKNEGTIHYNGKLDAAADRVFVRLYADDKLIKTETAKIGSNMTYALAVKLKPGLIKYRTEFGTTVGGKDTVLHTATNLVCGDAFIIEGQSNALATDIREESPPVTNEWIRSYANPSLKPEENKGNLWVLPVWKARKGEKAEIGWWGMELAKQLVERQKMPVFIINGAVGGTRIDQHQRNEENPADLTTIYGRMLWRVQQAKMTHGIRAILWHQGESDQGSAGPTGGFGWEAYQPLFIDMASGWKRDFPNVQNYYVFQIWPNACSMGGSEGSGDRLREKQRTLPYLFSDMSILSTLGIKPPGGCHYPFEGWVELANMVRPIIERDHYGVKPTKILTAPNLKRAAFSNVAKDTITLEFDQPVMWLDLLANQFYLDGEPDHVVSGSTKGNVLTLKLKSPSTAKNITYLKEVNWKQETLLIGENGLAALTFCEVPLLSIP